jgi:tripartite-type tricarboxylate transporter receptor subunit TctC
VHRSEDLVLAVLKRAAPRGFAEEAFGKLAFEPRGSTPEKLSAFVKEQLEVWRRVVGEVGINPE